MATVVLTPSEAEVLTVQEVQQQCRIDGNDEEGYLLDLLIPGVCALFESYTRHFLASTVVEDHLPCWPRTGRIDLGRGVVRSVSQVTYLDTAGEPQELSPQLYQVDPAALPGAVFLAPGASLPAMLAHPATLKVRYTAGFGSNPSEDLPRNVRLWLLLHVAHFWKNREASFSGTGELKPLLFADALISDYRHVPI